MSTKLKKFIVYFASSVIIVLALSTLSPTQAQVQETGFGETAREAMEAILPETQGEDPEGFKREIGRIVEDTGYAYGEWVYGEMAGVAIAHRKRSQWSVICSTGGVYQANEMVSICEVPSDIAANLWEKWIAEEE